MRLNPFKQASNVASSKFLRYMVNQRGVNGNLEKIRALIEMRSSQKWNEVQSLTRRMVALSRFISKAIGKCLHVFEIQRRDKKFQWTEEYEQAFQCLKCS